MTRRLGTVTLLAVAAMAVGSGCQDRTAGRGDNLSGEPQKAPGNALNTGAANASTSGNVSSDPAPLPSNWSYRTERDEARNAEIRYASVTSVNTVDFDFPYQGGSQAILVVRQHPQYGLDIFIQVQPSQFLCDSFNGCRGLISVDGRPAPLSLIPPADHSIDTIFVRNSRAILGRLRGSERVIVELPFYQSGNRQFTFSTAGLQWR